MDLGVLGILQFDLPFLSALLSIVLIDLILAGDNAVVIAMAVRSLPQEQRKKGILFGAGAAVLLRVVITFFVAQLLNVSYVKLIGGVLILWIAVKLFIEGAPEEGRERKAATVWQAVKVIVIADITMSLDNMLAVGGASHGNMFLLLFGLGLSIPFIVFTSNLLSMLMDRYPVIIYAGAAILGKVGGEMLLTDPLTVRYLPAGLLADADVAAPSRALLYAVEASFAAGVIVTGKVWMRMAAPPEAAIAVAPAAGPRVVPVHRPRPVLTISREFGSGGREIGLAVAQELRYSYVDRDRILDDIRTEGPRWEQWAKELDERCPTVWEKYDWSFRGYAALMQWRVLEHALSGGAVLMGRGGNNILKDAPQAYRIRVTAPPEQRIERIMQREGADRRTAAWLCERTDNERRGFLQAVYGRTGDDPSDYDRVLTVAGQSVKSEVRQVIDELFRRPVTEGAVEALRLRAVAAKVLAGIATDPSFFIPLLDVATEAGTIVLRGVIHTPKEHRRIEAAAVRLAGTAPVRCELHFRR